MDSESRETKSATTSPLVLLGELKGHRAGVRCVACSPDGLWTATADSSRRIVIWRGTEAHLSFDPLPFWQRFPSNRRIHSLAFSIDSSILFVALTDRLAAYDVDSGRRLWAVRGRRMLAFLPSSPTTLAAHPITGQLVTVYEDGYLSFWTPEGRSQENWFDNDAPRQLSFTRDGSKIVGTDGFSICIWDAATHAKLAKHMPKDKIHGFAVSSLNDTVATRTLYRVTTWNLETGQELGNATVGQGLPIQAFSTISEELAVGENQRISVMDFEGNSLAEATLPETIALAMAYSQDGRLFVACSDGVVRIYSA
jgi:WD40 repeat protein